MANRHRPGDRIEPSFDGRKEKDEDGFSLSASDRVVAPRGKQPAGNGAGRNSAASASRNRRADDDEPRDKSSRKSSRKARAPRQKRGGLFRFVRFVIYWLLVLGLWGGMAVAGLVVYYGARMPSAENWKIPERPPNVKIVDVQGGVIANRGSTGGEELALENMSPYIPLAVMAIEDRRFYSHFGIDPLGLARAMATNLVSGRMVQGGSTLTQQLAKNLFLSPDRTLERKVQEVLLALWLEHNYSKDQILAMYLNRVYFGSNAYGVEAASRRYFNKSARDVNLGEAALLAGLLKAPSRLSPARDPDAAEARAQVVLSAMREEGYITDKEIKTAMSQAPTKASQYWSGAQYFVADMVMEELPKLVGEIKEDVVVDTTLDTSLEKEAEQTLAKVLDRDGGKVNASQGALVSIDGTGAIRALVGGRSYADSQFNRAFKAKRQPGSAFKPFVYAAALEQGNSPLSMRNDAPVKIGKWTPENYDQKYRGPVRLIDALTESLNSIAAQLVMETGPDQVIKLAHRLGIASDLQNNASIALGTSEVTLAELTAAYAPFMNGGYKASPHVIRRITTVSGTVLYENTYDAPPRVLSDVVVVNMNAMLTNVVAHGTGKKAQLPGWQVAGKTGTTQSFRDALFVGYTSNLTTGVWVGNDDGKPMKKVTGGTLPAVIFHDFMALAHEGLSPAPLYGNGGILDPEMPIAGEEGLDPSLTEKIDRVLASSPDQVPQADAGMVAEDPGAGGTAAPLPSSEDYAPPPEDYPLPPDDIPPEGVYEGPVDGGPAYDMTPPELIGRVEPSAPPAGYRARRATLMDLLFGN